MSSVSTGLGIGMGGAQGGAPIYSRKSLLLDGANESVNIDSVASALSSDTVGTWSKWVKPVDATPALNSYLISFGDTDANTGLALLIGNTGKLLATARDGGVNQWILSTDAAVFSDNTWIHVAIVMDGVAPVLYVNAVAVAQTFLVPTDKTVWHNDLPGIDNGRIGALNLNSGGDVNHLNGNVDDTIFINRALTQPQIANLIKTGRPKNESAIANGVSGFRFGDAPGDNWNITGSKWNFEDIIGVNVAETINAEEADVVNDAP